MGNKKPRVPDEKQLEVLSQLRPIDDCFFEVMMEDADACEELLQVILENPKLRIKKDTVVGQKSIRIIGKRSIRVDAYTEGEEDVVYNIEIQKADTEDHVRRVRYNASVITVNRSEPGDDFKDVQELYIIYIADFDVLKNGRTVSHAEMTCKETGIPVDDGLHEIFVTTVGTEENKISRLMKEYKNPDMNNSEFPKQSKRVQEIKHNPEEVEKVCTLVENYAKEKVIQEAVEASIEFNQSEEETVARLVRKFELTEEEAHKYYDMYAPQLV